MKKYLITGALSLVACATLTSCHSDEEFSDSIISNKLKTYEEVFKEEFGEINSTQDWGFGAASQVAKIRAFRTRAANENHNQWYSTEAGVDAKYSNLEKDPDVTNEERIGVFRYMNHADTREKTNNIIWTDYFVSQVWDGGTNYILNDVIYGVPTVNSGDSRKYVNNLGDADNKITNNGVDASIKNVAEYTPLTTSYVDQNGATVTLPGGDYMDWLFVNETGTGSLEGSTIDKETGKGTGAGGWTHINNFNSSNNTDEWYAGKTWMTDNSGTYDFAYNQTEGSYFSNKYLIIPGTEIFANDATMLEKYGEYYYVCFDYEKGYTDAEKATEDTYIWFTPINKDGVEQQAQKVTFTNTYYTNDNLPTDAQILAQFGNGNYTSIKSGSVSVAGYKTGSQHFAGDNVYTDWIVRISPAKYKNITTPGNVRVMAEDLTLGTTDEDFDFNDVVFDVYFGAANTAKVVIRAAGGTLDLRIANVETPTADSDWFEVHDLFNEKNNRTDLAGKMLNTHGTDADQPANVRSRSVDGLACPEFTLPFAVNSNADAKKIKIQVKRNNVWTEIEADQGQPAAKFAVPTTVDWMKERVSIKGIYGEFTTWATSAPNLEWWNSAQQ